MEFITVDLVNKLIKDQFPEWSNLEIKPVENMGNDNRTFHLGDNLSVRLPSRECYALQSLKEQTWLPKLKSCLSVKVPEIVAKGCKSADYPYTWSICSWIDGKTANKDRIINLNNFAKDLAEFLISLQKIDTEGAPIAGSHNFYRGGDINVYDEEYRGLVENIAPKINLDKNVILEIWDLALSSKWTKYPVWVHGDLAPTNIIVLDGNLEAVIDFGILGIGDPACDLTMYWTFFEGESRKIFKDVMNLDEDTWNRARGWAIWKCLIDICNHPNDINNVENSKAIAYDLVNEYINM